MRPAHQLLPSHVYSLPRHEDAGWENLSGASSLCDLVLDRFLQSVQDKDSSSIICFFIMPNSIYRSEFDQDMALAHKLAFTNSILHIFDQLKNIEGFSLVRIHIPRAPDRDPLRVFEMNDRVVILSQWYGDGGAIIRADLDRGEDGRVVGHGVITKTFSESNDLDFNALWGDEYV